MKLPKISKNPSINFRNDEIQFSRLIAELEAVEAVGAFSPEIMWALNEQTDLQHSQIEQLIDRAQAKWDAIKVRM